MRAFLAELTLRPSCYACPFKSGRSGSDITLADFWNIRDVLPAFDDDRGASLVLLNTPQASGISKRPTPSAARFPGTTGCAAATADSSNASNPTRAAKSSSASCPVRRASRNC